MKTLLLQCAIFPIVSSVCETADTLIGQTTLITKIMMSNTSLWILCLTLLFVVAGQALSWLPARMVVRPFRQRRNTRNQERRKESTGDDTTSGSETALEDDDDQDAAQRSFLSLLPWWWEDSWSEAFLNSFPIKYSPRTASSSSSSLAATTTSSSVGTSRAAEISTELDDNNLLEEDELFHYQTPKPNPEASVLHFCFLLHGHRGYSTDLTYLQRGMQHYAEQEKEKQHENGNNNNNNNNNQSTQKQPPQEDLIVHCAACNEGRTADGVKNGGERLVQEMLQVIRTELRQRQQLQNCNKNQQNGTNDNSGNSNNNISMEDITISIVGNSLGGIYGRYAIAKLTEQLESEVNITVEGNNTETDTTLGEGHDSNSSNINNNNNNDNDNNNNNNNDNDNNKNNNNNNNNDDDNKGDRVVTSTVVLDGKYRLHFNIFCTTATPHLGISKHTFVPLPRTAEIGAAYVLGETGRDLFRLNDVMKTMATSPEFLDPLRKFRKRVAFANAYATDFPVPASTAAFLSEDSTYPHHFSDKIATGSPKADTDWKKIDKDNESGRIIATLHTHQAESSPQNPHVPSGTEVVDDLVQMSNSLDSLGWTKVFIDIRKEIPLGVSVSIPKSLQSGIGKSLLSSSKRLLLGDKNQSSVFDESTKKTDAAPNAVRSSDSGNCTTTATAQSTEIKSTISGSSHSNGIGENDEALPQTAIQKLRQKGVVESRDVASAVSIPEDMRFHFPIGHNLMVAKDGGVVLGSLYKGGRPVMDALAKRLVEDIFGWSLEEENEAAGKMLAESSVEGDVSYSNLF